MMSATCSEENAAIITTISISVDTLPRINGNNNFNKTFKSFNEPVYLLFTCRCFYRWTGLAMSFFTSSLDPEIDKVINF